MAVPRLLSRLQSLVRPATPALTTAWYIRCPACRRLCYAGPQRRGQSRCERDALLQATEAMLWRECPMHPGPHRHHAPSRPNSV